MADSAGDWVLMIDGAARGNPGQAGCGAVILDRNGTVQREVCRYLGHTTNNVAEYEALLLGLEELLRLGGTDVEIRSDSQLLVRQLNGLYRVKDERLRTLYEKALGLLRRFNAYRIIHIPRENNRLADRLANRAVDEASQAGR